MTFDRPPVVPPVVAAASAVPPTGSVAVEGPLRSRLRHLVGRARRLASRRDGRFLLISLAVLIGGVIVGLWIGSVPLVTWGIVAVTFVLAFLPLHEALSHGVGTERGAVGPERDAVGTEREDSVARREVEALTELNAQNAAQHERVVAAAALTTTLNERALRRIGSDIHDGPAQILSLALMRLDASTAGSDGDLGDLADDAARLRFVEGAVRDALVELRGMASGLRLPELDALTVPEVALRAVEEHRRRTGSTVVLEAHGVPGSVDPPVKIALFRTLQELLSNASRYGHGTITVALGPAGRLLRLEVSDEGTGFDPDRVGATGHLGLAGIREQAELLGGRFRVQRRESGRTTISVGWPMTDAQPPSAGGPVAGA